MNSPRLTIGILAFLLAGGMGSLSAEKLDAVATSALLNKITNSRISLGSMEVGFTEERTSPMARTPLVSAGTLALHPSGKFRREVTGQSIMVNDGEYLWIYYPSFHEVEKYAIASGGPAADVVAIISEGLQLHDLANQFVVTASRDAGRVVLELSPRGTRLKKLVRAMQIELDDQFRLVRLAWTSRGGDQTTVKFSDERAISSSDDKFRFSPPAESRVVTPLAD